MRVRRRFDGRRFYAWLFVAVVFESDGEVDARCRGPSDQNWWRNSQMEQATQQGQADHEANSAHGPILGVSLCRCDNSLWQLLTPVILVS